MAGRARNPMRLIVGKREWERDPKLPMGPKSWNRCFLWVCLPAAAISLLAGVFLSANQFLSMSRPVSANVLVVDGWLPDYCLQLSIDEFRSRNYEYLVTAGGPLEQGYFLSDYGNYAHLAGATLKKLGFPGDRLIEAPAPERLRNRTFESINCVRARLNDIWGYGSEALMWSPRGRMLAVLDWCTSAYSAGASMLDYCCGAPRL